MNMTPVISILKAERDKLDKAISTLETVNQPIPLSSKSQSKIAAVTSTDRRRLPMSETVRKKIAKAAKARWRKLREEKAAA